MKASVAPAADFSARPIFTFATLKERSLDEPPATTARPRT